MHYLIYKTINLIDGKEYVGKHQTEVLEDDYLGSGKLLQLAVKKHGRESFKREILQVFETEAEMNAAEASLVDEAYCSRSDTYNICPGGHGGWGYINQAGLNLDLNSLPIEILKESRSLGGKRGGIKSKPSENFLKAAKTSFKDKRHTEEAKRKISLKMKEKTGQKCSQYGTCWITNGKENKKIKRTDIDIWLQIGYSFGRI